MKVKNEKQQSKNILTTIKPSLKKFWEELKFPLLSILLAFLVGAIFVIWTGNNPIDAYFGLLQGSFGSITNIGATLVTTIPLIFTGLAVSFAFRCGLFNIGVEGQYIIGSVGAVAAGYFLSGLPAIILIPLVILVGAVFGGLWAGIAGYLKAKKGTHEVIITIMLNYIAFNISNFLTRTMLNPENRLLGVEKRASTVFIGEGARLTRFGAWFSSFQNSTLHTGIFVALIAALIVYYILWKTVLGYEIRAVGHNFLAAEYGGINVKKNIVLAMLMSGALAGMAGAVQVAGVNHRVDVLLAFTGYGFDGIAVALVGKNHPLGVVLSALLFAALQRGSSQMQIWGVPREISGIIQGIIIIFVTADQIVKFIIRHNKKKKEVA